MNKQQLTTIISHTCKAGVKMHATEDQLKLLEVNDLAQVTQQVGKDLELSPDLPDFLWGLVYCTLAASLELDNSTRL